MINTGGRKDSGHKLGPHTVSWSVRCQEQKHCENTVYFLTVDEVFFYSKILTNVITWSVLSVKTHPSGHGSVTGVLITSVTFFTPYNVTMHEYEQMHTHTVMTSRLRPTCSAFLSPVQKLFSIHFTLSLCERPLLCTNRRAY